ncbi:MAG: alpha/beta hydrolase [Proteobacteria bacterium]|nr:alpha/beta hydrolase [Pseudomonadota bacterium]
MPTTARSCSPKTAIESTCDGAPADALRPLERLQPLLDHHRVRALSRADPRAGPEPPVLRAHCAPARAALPARRIQAHVTLSDAFVDQAEATMDRWDEIAADEPFSIRALLAHLAAIRSHDSVPFLPAVDVPTLVMAGRDDRLVPWRNSVFLADRIPAAEFVLVEDCGHNIETEQPQLMARRVTEFVANRGWSARPRYSAEARRRQHQ